MERDGTASRCDIDAMLELDFFRRISAGRPVFVELNTRSPPVHSVVRHESKYRTEQRSPLPIFSGGCFPRSFSSSKTPTPGVGTPGYIAE
jgi:hypothetical protein